MRWQWNHGAIECGLMPQSILQVREERRGVSLLHRIVITTQLCHCIGKRHSMQQGFRLHKHVQVVDTGRKAESEGGKRRKADSAASIVQWIYREMLLVVITDAGTCLDFSSLNSALVWMLWNWPLIRIA
jgi:hypothetical protein